MKALSLPRHSATLDSLRAISSLVVLFGHALQIFWYPVVGLHGPVHRVTSSLTESAVIVFFLLSGYLITASIVGNVHRGGGEFSLLEYAVARLARIYPPLFVAIALTVFIFVLLRWFELPGIASPLRGSGDLYAARETLSLSNREIRHALLMNGGLLVMNGPLWSLYIEVRLYAAAGLVAWVLYGTSPLGVRSAVGLPALMLLLSDSVFRFPHFPLYATWWIMGVVCCVCRFKGHVSLPAQMAFCGLGAGVFAFTTTAQAVEIGRVCIMLALCYGMFARWKWRSSIFESMARSSYTLYLIHFPVSLLAYSVLVALAGNHAIDFYARLTATGVAILSSLGLSHFLARFTENTASTKAYLTRLLRMRDAGTYAPAQ